MTRPRVLLVDDHPVLRAGLVALLQDDGRLEVAGQAGSSAEALAAVDRLSITGAGVDLVLMDLHLGDGPDGIATTAELRGRGVPVLVLTTFDSDADVFGALDAGANGYVLKDSPTHAVVAAVFAVLDGQMVLSPEVQQRVVARAMRPADQLSPRELEILQAVAQGRANREIARELFISESTVKTHLAHLFTKLGVDNRTALVARARERRLIR